MSSKDIKVEIREVSSVEEFQECVELQRRVFELPDIEISPVRHLIVTKNAGGFTLAAFHEGKIIGFVLSVPMFNGKERAFYSHMTAVDKEYQNLGIGAKLKWAQRERALEEGIKYIKWTFQPAQARNAFFNLERLGAIVRTYAPNFYGTDYIFVEGKQTKYGIDSDRLFAEWYLEDPKVVALSKGEKYRETANPKRTIRIPSDWNLLLRENAFQANLEQQRIRKEFQEAFAEGLICRGFERSDNQPKYLLFET
ncbi:MAG: GNAT family N-acetyltransferase [Pyrinomonadaceae bacterium]|nr:GNAT family N-acetyltransferase [Pyrinomonadaceae bacterium]MCX7639911.1 GNAT family N-acetyltransferase [Pyrinomonadaceae bacterium]MDW8304083.1 GNAT family N-acetyltransferase [Acidobacteriota bacterium]